MGAEGRVLYSCIVNRQLDFDKLPAGVHPRFRVRFVFVIDQTPRYVVVAGKRSNAAR